MISKIIQKDESSSKEHLVIENIKKSFGDKTILKNISFSAEKSDIIGMIGKSGCGKSTFLKILVGYHKADSGKIYLDNKDVSVETMNLRKIVGYTTQENSFYEKLTLIENMNYYSNIYGIDKKTSEKRIEKLLHDVGLFEHRKKLAEKISGGMKRRLDFAISLVHNPSILVLDEPTVGLDPLLIEQFWKIVLEIVKKENKIAIISSHILPEIEKYCNRAIFMKDGEIIKEYSKKDKEFLDLETTFRKIII